MNGIIERIKNNVLLKCSTLNEEIIAKSLIDIIDKSIYHFAEDLISMLDNINLDINEEMIREKISELIKNPIVKKIKRKLFIDSLALQITNDSFIEDYVKSEITLDKLQRKYLKDLKENKNSNQLNMTEDLNLTIIFQELRVYVEQKIIKTINENAFLVASINELIEKSKTDLEKSLDDMIKDTDNKYLDILVNEILIEFPKEEQEEIKEEEGEVNMQMDYNNISVVEEEQEEVVNKFEKYDDMTLFNKVILSLNTKEERLTRNEEKLKQRKEEIEERLSLTNKNIEANIERENELTQRKMDLNSKEIELNAKLSETEVILLNIKPLIKGLNKIKESDLQGGASNE